MPRLPGAWRRIPDDACPGQANRYWLRPAAPPARSGHRAGCDGRQLEQRLLECVEAVLVAWCHVDPSVSWRVTCAWHASSEEHTSELQSLMRISSAVFCL